MIRRRLAVGAARGPRPRAGGGSFPAGCAPSGPGARRRPPGPRGPRRRGRESAVSRGKGGLRGPTTFALRDAAGAIAWGLRNLFNLPESMAIVRTIPSGSPGLRRDGTEPYWLSVLLYCAEGGLQAILDEYAHVLKDSLGLIDKPAAQTVSEIASEIRVGSRPAYGGARRRVPCLRRAAGVASRTSACGRASRFASARRRPRIRAPARATEPGSRAPGRCAPPSTRRSGRSSSRPPRSGRRAWTSTPTATPSSTGTCRRTRWTSSSARDGSTATRATR